MSTDQKLDAVLRELKAIRRKVYGEEENKIRMVRAGVVMKEVGITRDVLRGIKKCYPDLAKRKETGHYVFNIEAIKKIA